MVPALVARAVALGSVGMVVASIAVTGCGGDDSSGSEAQPVPGATVFQEGDFDELPRFRGAEAVNDPTVDEDVTTQSFEVTTATPADVMEFYERELAERGWDPVEPPRRTGAESSYRGVWQQGDRQLVVSSTEFAGADDPAGTRSTQYSLSLGPA